MFEVFNKKPPQPIYIFVGNAEAVSRFIRINKYNNEELIVIDLTHKIEAFLFDVSFKSIYYPTFVHYVYNQRKQWNHISFS